MDVPHEPYFYNCGGVNPRFVGGTSYMGNGTCMGYRQQNDVKPTLRQFLEHKGSDF